MTTQTWVVGVDGWDDSKTALAWAVAQATGRDAQILALCTWMAPILGETRSANRHSSWTGTVSKQSFVAISTASSRRCGSPA